jgi:transcription-repair coupling factor (superfamily II helicase)
MRDLEIRGAGNILGAEQHGHMDKIGYELYSKLLREEISGVEEVVPELDVRVTAFIPDGYIENNIARMDAYKEIAEINSLQTEKDFRTAIEEAYGSLPYEADNLINIAVVKMLAMKLKATEITIRKGECFIAFSDYKIFADKNLLGAIDDRKEYVRISMSKTPKVEFVSEGEGNAEMLLKVKDFLLSATDQASI